MEPQQAENHTYFRMIADLKEDYAAYVARFMGDDAVFNKNIRMKEKHTLRVCREILDIGDSLGLDEHGRFIAEVSALFHDVGRYEQFRRYGTFLDAKSEDHARLGVKVIQENRMLDMIAPRHRELVLTVVENHNKLSLPDTLDGEGRFFTKLLRDADKIDIWKVVLEYYASAEGERVESIGLGLPDDSAVSDAVCRDLLSGKMVMGSRMKSLNDFKLLQMGWVYDLNFRRSFEIVRERDYIGRIYLTMPHTPVIDRIYGQVAEYVSLNLSC